MGILGGLLNHVFVTITVDILGGIWETFVVTITVGILGGILSHVCCHDISGHTGRTIESCLLSR